MPRPSPSLAFVAAALVARSRVSAATDQEAEEAEEAWRELVEARKRCSAARAEYDDSLEARDRAILEASEMGYTRRDVARAAGVSPGRVQQILDW
jgi:DNA-binding NarL/FixJ family response regulator